ncbi:uncharacterized protein YALI0A18139g-like [Acyrthosiphon pisum]|uniref:Uncharacterized protein n=1 Tax=Acyrthosiphon pisum TaxID=7029 RepID=A0A8R2H2P4_ACYPI|nr:uncharacterized protein YALI0A18139g-like [Acyrthosiphon pisum]|eukprot:XP_016656275.1 PREDICTED: uncharacterized protein YALI0A18139g-like [Acyrthosiphon pisum]
MGIANATSTYANIRICNDEHLIALGKKTTKLTDIYIQKKPELIELCKSKQLKSVGTVDNLRARLSRYYKGIVELDDIEETLSDQQKLKIQKDSTEDRIDIKELLTQSSSSDSSPETTKSARYSIILKNKLENRKQNDLESISSFVTEIEYLCSQVQKDMKEEEICVYILKGIREPILHAISLHDNSTLKKLKENLKKYELMQFRINSRSSGISDFTEILNKQVMQLNNETKDSIQEIKRLNRKLEGVDSYHKNKIDQLCTKIDQLCTEMHNFKKYDKTVNFEDRSRTRDKSPYPGKADHDGRNNYREKSPHSDRYNDNRFRDNNRNTGNSRDRSYSRDRGNSFNRSSREMRNNRDMSYDRSRDTSRNRYNNRNRENEANRKRKQQRRDNSRDRYSRSTTPEKLNRRENITCYINAMKMDTMLTIAIFQKTNSTRAKKKIGISNSGNK